MRNQKYSDKGFTLVEVIVVLVILALLAAIAIPAMTGWIDKAKEKRLIVACRTCVNAAQTLVVETYGATNQATLPVEGDVTQLAGVPGDVSDITLADTAIATLTYTDPASSDFVTYTLSPGPKYEFGTGLSVAQAAAKIDFVSWNPKTPGRVPIYSTLLDVYNGTTEEKWEGYADFVNGLPADVKARLSGKTWGLNRQKACLFVCDGTVTDADIGKMVTVTRYPLPGSKYEQKTQALRLVSVTVDGKKKVVIPMDMY